MIYDCVAEVTFSSLSQTHVRDLEFSFSAGDPLFPNPVPFLFALKQWVTSKLFHMMASQTTVI
jgi:hypothetical protein